MRLYLMQHGKAKSKEEDPERPLTEEGRAEVERVARTVSRGFGGGPVRVLHSGKARARETAEVLAASLPSAQVEEAEGLAPMDDPRTWAKQATALPADAALVGHLPHLARLASTLLADDPDREVVRFTNGGVVCLDRSDAGGGWAVVWSVVPGLVA